MQSNSPSFYLWLVNFGFLIGNICCLKVTLIFLLYILLEALLYYLFPFGIVDQTAIIMHKVGVHIFVHVCVINPAPLKEKNTSPFPTAVQSHLQHKLCGGQCLDFILSVLLPHYLQV